MTPVKYIRRRRRFTPAEDAALTAMRVAGDSVYTIAKRLTPARSRSSVQSRLETLARQAETASQTEVGE